MVNVPQIIYPQREQPVQALTEGLMQGIQLQGLLGRVKGVPKEQREYAPPEPQRQTVNVNDFIKTEKQDFDRLSNISKQTSKLSDDQRRKVLNTAVESGYINSELFREAVAESDMTYKELGDLMMKIVRGEEDARIQMAIIMQKYGEDSKVAQAIGKKIKSAKEMQAKMDEDYSLQLVSIINTAQAYQDKWPSFKNMPEGAKKIVKNKMKYLAELKQYNPEQFRIIAENMLDKKSTTVRRKQDYKATFKKNGKKYHVPIAADNIEEATRQLMIKYQISQENIIDIYNPDAPVGKTMAREIIAPFTYPSTTRQSSPATTKQSSKFDHETLKDIMD